MLYNIYWDPNKQNKSRRDFFYCQDSDTQLRKSQKWNSYNFVIQVFFQLEKKPSNFLIW